MHPILFQFQLFQMDITIPTFGVLMALAFLLGGGWFIQRGGAAGFSKTKLLDALPWVIVASIVGARVFYLLFFPDQFWQDPIGVAFGRGGLVWYGGVVAAIGITAIICRQYHIPFWQWMDWLVPPAALGLAIGRVGCFFAGCCYGGPCTLPWAITYPPGHETYPHAVHPAPLYESLGALILAGTLVWVENRFKPTIGVVALYGIIGYALLRFGLEYLRADRLVWFEPLNLSASQVIGLVIILFAAVFLYTRTRQPAMVESR